MTQNYQDTLLSAVRKENMPVTIFLTNGFQIRGQIKAFDAYVIIVEADGKQQMVYKHAISTIAPLKAVLKLQVVDRIAVTEANTPETAAEGESKPCFTTA
ncbi:MAG: RNA chaperone Hfq [Defluviitaleaceae bacterium]|nr:RNA chaperone Hfq [Defluviitaleaceae bacterium]MCL2240168.1 RNA chaperone Hfq [Defluviitaleaceae bacterium]